MYKMTHDLYEEVERCLSDADIKRELPDARIIDYSTLKDYHSVEQLLPKLFDYVIILVELQFNVGHWVAVLRLKNNIIYFDPYGGRVDKALSWVDKYMRKELGQETPYLTLLFNKAVDDGFN